MDDVSFRPDVGPIGPNDPERTMSRSTVAENMQADNLLVIVRKLGPGLLDITTSNDDARRKPRLVELSRT